MSQPRIWPLTPEPYEGLRVLGIADFSLLAAKLWLSRNARPVGDDAQNLVIEHHKGRRLDAWYGG